MSDKPTVLVLGGLGFIGRNFVTYIIENELASEIRVVDKVLLKTTALNARQTAAFSKVEVLQGDLAVPATIPPVYSRGDEGSYDYVFNLAAETKHSQNETVYQERIYGLSCRNAEEAAKRKVKAFVEVSTAEIYKNDKNPSKEDSKIKPWTVAAEYKYKAEEKIKTIEGLNLVVLRTALVYGPGATMGLAPHLVCGRIYQFIKEEMKFLWSKDLKVNTVHVNDVCRALWFIATWYQENKVGKGPVIYNLADLGDTDQEKIRKHIGNIFGIKTGFQNSAISTLAQRNLDNALDDINDKHMLPWSTLLKNNKIRNTPLSPYLDKEALLNNSLSVDGRRITIETGFQYEVPQITDEKLKEMIDNYIALGLWPVID